MHAVLWVFPTQITFGLHQYLVVPHSIFATDSASTALSVQDPHPRPPPPPHPAHQCHASCCCCRYEFTLHGMWPQRRDGTWPEFCDPSSHIDMDQLDDLMDDMEHDWPSWSSADEVGVTVVIRAGYRWLSVHACAVAATTAAQPPDSHVSVQLCLAPCIGCGTGSLRCTSLAAAVYLQTLIRQLSQAATCPACCPRVQTFWDHEWNRHGTCAAPVTGGQHRYFQAVLALHHKLNLQVCSIRYCVRLAVDGRSPAALCAACCRSMTPLGCQAVFKPTTQAVGAHAPSAER